MSKQHLFRRLKKHGTALRGYQCYPFKKNNFVANNRIINFIYFFQNYNY